MINVASKELCEELKELSGWSDTVFCWNGQLVPSWWPPEMRAHEVGSFPAYDLGYLMRKLPQTIKMPKRGNVEFRLHADLSTDNPVIGYAHAGYIVFGEADTLEDASAKLAIELFKQGVLKK